MNSIIEAQVEYFTKSHYVWVVCLNDWQEDGAAWDHKLKNLGATSGKRDGDVSISAKTYLKQFKEIL
jgi:hypothetical protein